MNTNEPAPIVLFAYNRLDHTRRTVEALKTNILAQRSDLFIFSDAPKSDRQAKSVSGVREYIKTISGFRSVSIVERDSNWGLANSIIDGVTSVVNERGRIIVLEDDLVVTPHFLEFMNRALDRYEHERQVIQVSGYMFPTKVQIEDDALFLPLTTSWGWATWKRAWELFDPEASGYKRLKTDAALRKSFNLDGAYDYFSMLEAQLAGQVDSWAVRWQLSAFMTNSLTLYPRHSLIVNAGFDGSGTHGAKVGALSRSGVAVGFSPERLPMEVKVSVKWEEVCRMLRNRYSVWDRFRTKVHILARRLRGFVGVST